MSTTKTVTRKAAIKAGERHYFTGKPCKRGHVSIRYTDTCNCVECMKERIYRDRSEIAEIRRGEQ